MNGKCYYFTFEFIQNLYRSDDLLPRILSVNNICGSQINPTTDIKLVHGVGVNQSGESIEHAWIELLDFVYDVTADEDMFFEKTSFYENYQISNQKSFSYSEVLSLLQVPDEVGFQWHDLSPEIVSDVCRRIDSSSYFPNHHRKFLGEYTGDPTHLITQERCDEL